MAPKIPSDKALEKALEDAVLSIFDSDERDQLTVNYVRQVAEKKLGLDDGFFKTGDWKARSKDVARKAVDKAEANALNSQQSTASPKPDSDVEAEPEPTPKAKPKAKTKAKPKSEPKQKPNAKAKPTKKRKAASSDEESESPSSDSSDISDASDSDASDSDAGDSDASDSAASSQSSDSVPKRKGRQAKAAAKSKKRKSTTDDEDDGSTSDSEPQQHPRKKAKSADTPKPAPKAKGKPTKPAPKPNLASESGSPLSDAPTTESVQAEVAVVTKVGTPIVEDESEMSEVFDEPPKRKGKSGAKVAKGERKTKAPAKPSPADLSPDDALIKQLQGQLNKCGVRKIWGVLLKKYGDDKKAKIRHLKGMLTDVGMVGRFSESRAREIKERRELLADLDEVKEGEKSWGLGSTRPSRRAAAPAKPLRVSSSESDDDEENSGGTKARTDSGKSDDDDESDGSGGQVKRRARGPAKHRNALAFLGDDSESD